MSCQFHPTISDSKPASPTAVLLHLYYLHDPRLGLPRSHHSLPADLSSCLPPPCPLDDDDSELEDYDDEELWCAGPGLYVAYECVRVWIEADTAVRELCEHLEDVVSWPIDDMGVQVWHGDSKLHPTHTFQQLAWFRQLLPATTASPPSSPYDRVLLCLPADPCVCSHCCRIDFARAKRRVKLVRRHIEQHYTEVVMADDEEEEEEARKRDGTSGKANRGKNGKGVEEDDSWMDEVDTADKEKSKRQKGKGAAAASKSGKKKQSKEAQRLAKKEKEAKEEKEQKAREQREKELLARDERARREAGLVAEQERVERDREEARRLREQQKEWMEEEKKAAPVIATKVICAPIVAGKRKQKSGKAAHVDKHQLQSTNAADPIAPARPPQQQQQPQQQTQRQPKSKAASVASTSPVSKRAVPHKQTAAVNDEPQHNIVTLPAQHYIAEQHDAPQQSSQHLPQQSTHQQRWKPATGDSSGLVQHATSHATPRLNNTTTAHPALPATTTTRPAAVSHSTLSNASVAASTGVASQPPKWKGWGSPCATRACPPTSFPQPLPLSPHSTDFTYATHSSMSPYPLSSTASTDDDNSSLNSDSFSLFSSASALLPPSSPTSFRSHRLSSASSSNSASTVTSPCLSALSGQSLSPSLPPLFCDKSADVPLPAVLSPFIASRVPSATMSSRASTLWPLSQLQHVREGELRRHWLDDDDEDAVLQAACSEYSYYADEQQSQQPDEQHWPEHTAGWYGGDAAPQGGWALGKAAPGAAAFAKYDSSMYNTQYRPYREGLLVSHVGAVGGAPGAAPVHDRVVGQAGPQLYGYMPLVQYVPVYISNEQAQTEEG